MVLARLSADKPAAYYHEQLPAAQQKEAEEQGVDQPTSFVKATLDEAHAQAGFVLSTPGNSGGALYDEKQNLIGIVSASRRALYSRNPLTWLKRQIHPLQLCSEFSIIAPDLKAYINRTLEKLQADKEKQSTAASAAPAA